MQHDSSLTVCPFETFYCFLSECENGHFRQHTYLFPSPFPFSTSPSPSPPFPPFGPGPEKTPGRKLIYFANRSHTVKHGRPLVQFPTPKNYFFLLQELFIIVVLTLLCLGEENIYLDNFDVKLRKKLLLRYFFKKYLFLQKRKTNLF